ncbi:MAG: pilus assembly protein [Lachnospiraceae bacterium]|nr:pilus assembly protein [Lachnospiraceae bacterium]
MVKKLNGYMTVEASLVIPLVLCIFVMIIKAGFLIYDRCMMSQDQYLAAFRSSCFTAGEESYGEVIYGEYDSKKPDLQYAKDRVCRKQAFYPMFGNGEVYVKLDGDRVRIWAKGFEGFLEMEKAVMRNDVFAVVRKRRQKKDGS